VTARARTCGRASQPRHMYTSLAAVDEYGVVHGEARDPEGLTFAACVELIMSLPKDALLVGYMLSCDWTKILERLDPEDIFYLLRPDARASRICESCRRELTAAHRSCPSCGDDAKLRAFTAPRQIGNYRLDFFNGTMAISTRPEGQWSWRKKITRKVWDVFRFLGCSCVEALKNWNIGSKETRDRIKAMKDQRGAVAWGEDAEDVERYCKEECELLAILMR